MTKHIQLLDCTLRDGGLNFDDAARNGLPCPNFTPDMDRIVRYLSDSRIDLIELGSIEQTPVDKRGFAIYQDIESVSALIPKDPPRGQQFVALYRGPDTPVAQIPEWGPSRCKLVRVILRYSELRKSLDYCRVLAGKGYDVFVQPALTMRYSEAELQSVIDTANEIGAYALYIVDTYGYMFAQDVLRLFRRYDERLDAAVRIGFHAHNNMDLAFSNALAFLEQETERRLIVDSCVLGIGQGAGNLQTEVIADHLIRRYGADYDYASILNVCEILDRYWTDDLWGYSVTPLLSALRGTAYKYATSLRHRYHLTYPEIDRLLRNVPEDMRHRYTPENTIHLLEMFGYDPLERSEGET